MAQLPFKIGKMLSAPGLRRQFLEAVDALAGELPPPDAPGHAYKICEVWQRRLELALRSEIPDWAGLAAFRCVLDFTLSPAVLAKMGVNTSPSIGTAEPVWRSATPRLTRSTSSTEANPQTVRGRGCLLKTLEDCQQAYLDYLENGQDHCSGKFILENRAVQDWFLEYIHTCTPILGGQAGNILWLWHCVGADTHAYIPYLSERFAGMLNQHPALAKTRLLTFNEGPGRFDRLEQVQSLAGVPCGEGRSDAPLASSLTAVKNGRRIIYSFPGVRVLNANPPIEWDYVQFFYQGHPQLEQPLVREAGDFTWPSIPLFCESRINTTSRTLEITLVDETQLAAATKGRIDFAVIGGMEAIYYDPWLRRDALLQALLLGILEKQLKALAASGTRIGVELSGIPGRDYAYFIRDLCHEDVIVTLGINGVDELPVAVGKEMPAKGLHNFWLNPQNLDHDLQAEIDQRQTEGQHFEYITYLRAKKLAEVTRVRTLYVHTQTLDFILRRDTDPGALLRAQLGDMMGKGLVIAALLQRSYGERWLDELERMPPAVNPRAMSKLGCFARDFERYEKVEGGDRLLTSGYWLAPSRGDYSVAVAPIVWPSVAEGQASEKLPTLMNPTGAGDMAFGAFFFLGGV